MLMACAVCMAGVFIHLVIQITHGITKQSEAYYEEELIFIYSRRYSILTNRTALSRSHPLANVFCRRVLLYSGRRDK